MAFTPEQHQAIVEEGNNILVSAGAGSGKTTVLSERVLRKVLSGNVNIDEILILTFTKAAANSMKNKIREKLIENKLDNQLELLDKSYITTFDSFTEGIIKKYHDRLNISKDISIIDENSINLYKEECLDKIFEKKYLEKDKDFIKLIEDYCLKDDKDLKEAILKINKNFDLKFNKREALENYINDYYSDEYVEKIKTELLNEVFKQKDLIEEYLKDFELAVDNDVYTEFKEPLLPLLNATTYDEIRNSLDLKLSAKRKPDGITEVRKSISNCLDKIKELCISETEEELVNNYVSTKDYLKVIVQIILELDEEIFNFKLDHNAFEFVDISKLAINLVKENSDIREELTNSFKEIMIDEYQDTSDLQETFISLIARNNTYMVGDIKQSIYRFRNANPDIFKQKYIDYSNNKNGIKIDLNKNFRSREESLININDIFDEVMNIKFGGADYKASHRMQFGNTSYNIEGKTTQNNNIELLNYTIDKESIYNKYDLDEIETFIIGKDIKDKIENKYQIFDKKNKVLRDIKYSDCVIIVDRSTKFDNIKKIFEYLKIPLTVFKKVDISKTIELYLIRNILKLLECLDNNDRENNSFKYSFTSIARSYLFEYKDDYIYNVINDKKYNDTDIIQILNNIKNDLPYLDLKTLMERIKEDFKFDEKILSTTDIEVKISTLEYFINLADNLASIDYDYHKFIEYLDYIINDDKLKIEIPVSIVDKNSATLMTIHTSKGLEYPICYFPSMYNGFNISDIRSKVFCDSKYGIIFPSFINGYQDTFPRVLAKNRYVLDEISEKIRLFYVALTRCEEKMIVVTSLSDKSKEQEDYRSFLDILNSVKDELTPYVEEIDLDKINISKDYKYKKVSKIEDYPYQELNVNEYGLEKNDEIEESHFSKTNNKLITKEEKENMEFGTKMHELFEFIDFKNVDLDKFEVSDYLKQKIMNFLNQDLLKNISDANIIKEYEFYYEKDNALKHGIIDLIIEYSDHIDIIDYKLKHIDDKAYIEQLNGYRDYIENKTKKEVNTYLYSIIDNAFTKIPKIA